LFPYRRIRSFFKKIYRSPPPGFRLLSQLKVQQSRRARIFALLTEPFPCLEFCRLMTVLSNLPWYERLFASSALLVLHRSILMFFSCGSVSFFPRPPFFYLYSEGACTLLLRVTAFYSPPFVNRPKPVRCLHFSLVLFHSLESFVSSIVASLLLRFSSPTLGCLVRRFALFCFFLCSSHFSLMRDLSLGSQICRFQRVPISEFFALAPSFDIVQVLVSV